MQPCISLTLPYGYSTAMVKTIGVQAVGQPGHLRRGIPLPIDNVNRAPRKFQKKLAVESVPLE